MSFSASDPTANSTTTLVRGWSTHPIPDFTLSAAGLILLADLSTIAQRTLLRGGSSWLDSLLLAPGLHYQQAADELSTVGLRAVELGPDRAPRAHRIVNQAVVNYVLRIAKDGKTVVLDVGEIRSRSKPARPGGLRGARAVLYSGPRAGAGPGGDEVGWAAHLLYLASPLLTCVAIVFIVLLADWWALSLLVALMLSRVLNIYVIKSRSRPKPPPPLPAPFNPSHHPSITEYTITLNPTTAVILRGLSTDLYALTTTVWLRPKTHVEGYLEAAAKLLVYMVAAVSGNATQVGNMILLALVLASAAFLALCNAHTTGLRNGGRVVAPSPSPGPAANKYGLNTAATTTSRRVSDGYRHHHDHHHHHQGVWTEDHGARSMANSESSSGSVEEGMQHDAAEKGRADRVLLPRPWPSDAAN